MSDNLVFCPSCGDMVKTYETHRDDIMELRCGYCGLTLESAVLDVEIKKLERVIVVDDSELITTMLNDKILENELASKVVTAPDGGKFITTLVNTFEKRKPLDLVILDIQMPIMSGINAAVAMRAIEEGFSREDRKIPILFFSVKRCDDNLKKVIDFCEPAQYLNKGVSNTPDEMFDRVKKVLVQLLNK